MILLTKISWFDQFGDPIEEDLSHAINWNINSALELKNNKTTVVFQNTDESASNKKFVDTNGNIKFSEGQILKFYAKYATSASDVIDTTRDSTDLLMVCDIEEFNPIYDESKIQIKVVGIDKSFVAMNKIWSEVFDLSSGKTAPQIIKEILRNTTQSELGDGGYSIDASLTTDTPVGYIAGTRRTTNEDGTSNTDTTFPVVSYTKAFKPIYEWISELSQIEYTNTNSQQTSGSLTYGKPFIFYIDENNRFHWFYPEDTIDSSLVVGTDQIFNINLTKKVFDVTNMIIFGAGNDMSGVQITGYVYDDTSNSKNLKMRWQPMEDIARDFIRRDLDKNSSRDAGTVPQYPSVYPITPVWTPTSTYASTVADDTEYNDSLWEASIAMGEARARRILSGTSHARWKGSIEVRGQRFTAGHLIQFTSTDIGLNAEKLRIMDVKYSFRKDGGWIATLELEQDQKALGSI